MLAHGIQRQHHGPVENENPQTAGYRLLTISKS